MGDEDNKPKFGIWKDSPQPSSSGEAKASHEHKGWEKGVGNREPEGPPKSESKAEISVGPLYKLETTLEGSVVDSRKAKGADQKSFYQFAQGKVGDVEIASASVNLSEAKAKATLVKGKAEGSVAHAELDIVDQIKKLLFGDDPSPPPPPPPPATPSPMAARVGDLVVHGGLLAPGVGSPDVFIGSLPAWRAGIDVHLCAAPGPPHGIGMAVPGATTVFINSFPAARAGDCVIEATGGPDMIVLGCTNVFVGEPAPPPSPPGLKKPPEEPSVSLEAVAKGDFLAGEADAQVYGEIDLAKGKAVVEAQAGVMVAVLKGELPLKVNVPIPGTDLSVALGLTLEGTLFSAGAEAGGGVKINDGDKLVSGTWGAKMGAGVGGVGAKFGFELKKNDKAE